MSLHSLPIFVRLQGRPVILVGSGETAEAKRRLLERAGALVVGEDLAPLPAPGATAEGDAGAAGPSAASRAPRLAIVVDDEAAVARLKARGILVNAVDRPELCDFTLPAIVDRNPVIVAIGTGGASAGLAAALRQRLEALLPATLGQVADALFAARRTWRARYPDMTARRRAIASALSPGGAYDPLLPHKTMTAAFGNPPDHDPNDLPEQAAARAVEIVTMTLVSRDPDDLTLRQARALANADRVCHGSDVPAPILDRARADADRIVCAEPPRDLPGLTVDVRMR